MTLVEQKIHKNNNNNNKIKTRIFKITLLKSIFEYSSENVEKHSIKIIGQLVLDIFNSDPLLSNLRCYEKEKRKRKKYSFL